MMINYVHECVNGQAQQDWFFWMLIVNIFLGPDFVFTEKVPRAWLDVKTAKIFSAKYEQSFFAKIGLIRSLMHMPPPLF